MKVDRYVILSSIFWLKQDVSKSAISYFNPLIDFNPLREWVLDGVCLNSECLLKCISKNHFLQFTITGQSDLSHKKIPKGYSGKSLFKTSSDLILLLIRNH